MPYVYENFQLLPDCYPLPGKTGKLPEVRVRAGKIVTANFTGEIPGIYRGKRVKGKNFFKNRVRVKG